MSAARCKCARATGAFILWAWKPDLAAERHHLSYGPSDFQSYGPIDFQFRNPEYRELLLSGLRLAAGEET